MPWTIGGNDVTVQADIELTPRTLSLSAVVANDNLDPWRSLGERAGDIDVQPAYGGRFRAFRRGDARSVTVAPPAAQSPPFADSEWFVSAFSVDRVGADRSEVGLTLQRPSPRGDEFSFSGADLVPADAGFGLDFGTDFGAGDIDRVATIDLQGGDKGSLGLTQQQVGRPAETETPTGTKVDWPVVLTAEQAAAFADAVGTPGAVVERSVPDGESVTVDSSAGRQTIIVDVQRSGGGLPAGAWAVADWTLTAQQPTGVRRWRASLSLRELSDSESQ